MSTSSANCAGNAQSQARGDSSQDFAAEMVIKAKERGLDTYLSEKQLAWLCKIADWDMPKKVTALQRRDEHA